MRGCRGIWVRGGSAPAGKGRQEFSSLVLREGMRRLTVTRASSFLGGEASAGRPAGRRCCLRTVVAPRGAARNRGKPPPGRGRIPQELLAAEGRGPGAGGGPGPLPPRLPLPPPP